MKRLLLVSCLAPLTALLFGGCGEDPVTSPERAMFTTEVTPFTPVEVVQVSADGTVKTTNTVLESGVLYQVRVSGTVQSGGAGIMADAEFADFSNLPGSLLDACDNAGSMVDVGLSINDDVNDNLKSPDWGAFSQAHTYTYDIIGEGQPLSFKFHDCNYSDNAGNFNVQLFRASEQNFQPLETILVPANGTQRTTSNVLLSGVTYKIRVSGTVNVGGAGTGTADAEFADFSDIPNSLADNCNAGTLVDVGLAINDTQIDANRLPDWGTFNAGHVYEVEYIGTGAPITFSFHDCNFSDNTGNLVVQIFGPNGPVNPPPSGNFRTVETLQVPANCSAVASTTVLDAGVTYQIRVSGTVFIGGPGTGTADAEFANFSNVPGSLMNNCDNLPTGVDIGLAINDVDLDTAKFPNWGSFKQNHTYVTTVQGTGEPLSFSFHDCNCGDNSGFLTVEIRAPRSQGPGQGGPQIDVRPGASRNFVNPRSHGMLMVALLGAEDFDVNSLTVSSLSLAAGSSGQGAEPKNSRLRDVNRDGIMDLVLQFKINELNIQQTDTELCLTGLMSGGESLDACDSIEIVGGSRGM